MSRQFCNFCIKLGFTGLITENPTDDERLSHVNLHLRHLKLSTGNEACDIYEQCFGTTTSDVDNRSFDNIDFSDTKPKSTDGIASKKGRPLPTSFTIYCRKLFAKQRRHTTKVECSLCGQRLLLQVEQRGRGINSKSIANHARTHLGKYSFECRHCEHKSTGDFAIRKHIANVHGLSSRDAYVDRSEENETEICAMIKKCFGQNEEGTNESNSKRISSVDRYFYNIYKAQWRKSASVRCNECGMDITVVMKSGKRVFFRAVDHACIHFGKRLFTCRYCPHKTVTGACMKGHLRKRHSLGSNAENFINSVGEYRDEIADVIDKCFARDDLGNEEQRSTVVQLTETERRLVMGDNIIKSRAAENTLFAERQLHSRRLLTKFAESGFIKCRVCSHVVNVKQPGGISNQKAIWHASTHAPKPLFRCRLCQKMIHVMSSVYRHMKKEHGITKGVAKQYDDLSDECQQDILSALTRSFDWSEK